MMWFIKHGVKKILIWRWYGKYINNNKALQEDILQTLLVRGSKVKFKDMKHRFSHLMIYYPEFAYIFFWRLKTKRPLGASLFEKTFVCKIFKSTKIEGGLMCYHPFATVINAK